MNQSVLILMNVFSTLCSANDSIFVKLLRFSCSQAGLFRFIRGKGCNGLQGQHTELSKNFQSLKNQRLSEFDVLYHQEFLHVQ